MPTRQGNLAAIYENLTDMSARFQQVAVCYYEVCHLAGFNRAQPVSHIHDLLKRVGQART